MPRNGAGTYNPPASTWNPGVNGVTATTADFNGLLTDMSAAITQSVSADGQTPMTGNLPMGNNKITGVAPGTATTDAVNLSQVNSNAGQCRLVKSGANLVLQPFQGNRLTINGVVYTIPAAGVSLAPAGSVATTLYYIYAYMVGAVMTLEYSATGHSTDATTGVEIKTGDATRTLVGMARPVAGPLWSDTLAARFVASWFNRRPVETYARFTSGTATSTAAIIEINGTIRNEFLTWADASTSFSLDGYYTHSVNGVITQTAIGIDSGQWSGYTASTSNGLSPVACTATTSLTEGYHFATLFAGTASGTATYAGGASFATTSVKGLVFI